MKTPLISLSTGMLACLVLAVVPGSVLFADAPDTSTPKKTGIAFAKALETGDMAGAKAVATGGEAEWKIAKMLSDFDVAMLGLQNAMIKKFGADAKLPDEMMVNLVADFESREEKIDGDTAILFSKKMPDDKFPPTVKKVGDGWKMDLSNMSQDPNMAMAEKMMEMGTKRIALITPNVENGKYQNKDEVMAAIASPTDPK